MLQIVLLVSLESSRRGGVHGLGSMVFGPVLAGSPVLVGTTGSSLQHFPGDGSGWVLVPFFFQKWDSVLVSFFQLGGSVLAMVLLSFFKLGRFRFPVP
jgi:hypothetical protein